MEASRSINGMGMLLDTRPTRKFVTTNGKDLPESLWLNVLANLEIGDCRRMIFVNRAFARLSKEMWFLLAERRVHREFCCFRAKLAELAVDQQRLAEDALARYRMTGLEPWRATHMENSHLPVGLTFTFTDEAVSISEYWDLLHGGFALGSHSEATKKPVALIYSANNEFITAIGSSIIGAHIDRVVSLPNQRIAWGCSRFFPNWISWVSIWEMNGSCVVSLDPPRYCLFNNIAGLPDGSVVIGTTQSRTVIWRPGDSDITPLENDVDCVDTLSNGRWATVYTSGWVIIKDADGECQRFAFRGENKSHETTWISSLPGRMIAIVGRNYGVNRTWLQLYGADGSLVANLSETCNIVYLNGLHSCRVMDGGIVAYSSCGKNIRWEPDVAFLLSMPYPAARSRKVTAPSRPPSCWRRRQMMALGTVVLGIALGVLAHMTR